jgi:ABC-type multidrug transport system fused ATPase/permease subunit
LASISAHTRVVWSWSSSQSACWRCAIAEVNAAIQEAVTGISVAKNFRQEAAIYGEFQRVNYESYSINLRRGFVLSNVFPVLNMVGGVGTAALVYFGGVVAWPKARSPWAHGICSSPAWIYASCSP